MPRTTIDLPPDLHQKALAIARDTSRTLSETVADLMRRGLRGGVAEDDRPYITTDEKTGLPQFHSRGGPITIEEVRSLEDEW